MASKTRSACRSTWRQAHPVFSEQATAAWEARNRSPAPLARVPVPLLPSASISKPYESASPHPKSRSHKERGTFKKIAHFSHLPASGRGAGGEGKLARFMCCCSTFYIIAGLQHCRNRPNSNSDCSHTDSGQQQYSQRADTCI